MMHVIIATPDRAPILASGPDALARQAWPGRPFDVLLNPVGCDQGEPTA
jgi:hypothetical protein